MTTLLLINSLLIGSVALITLAVIVYWHRATAGAWRNYPAGRTQMRLLIIIFVITANAAVQTLIPVPIMIKAIFYFGLYAIFGVALARIGFNIRTEIRRWEAKDAHPANNTPKESFHD